MTLRAHLLRIALMLGLFLGPAHQLAVAAAETGEGYGAMTAGHSGMMGPHASMEQPTDAFAQKKAALDLLLAALSGRHGDPAGGTVANA